MANNENTVYKNFLKDESSTVDGQPIWDVINWANNNIEEVKDERIDGFKNNLKEINEILGQIKNKKTPEKVEKFDKKMKALCGEYTLR